MSMPVDGLDKLCGSCGRPAGDHTMREWAACLGALGVDLPYEEVPSDAKLIADAVRSRFGLEEGSIVVDGVVVRAAVLTGDTGGVSVRLCGLIHDFHVNVVGQPPTTLAKVVLVGTPEMMRKYGRLARDSANGAASRVERGS